MTDGVDDLILGWTLIDLGDPALKRAAVIAEKVGMSVDHFIDEAIAEKVARWETENPPALADGV